MSSTLKEDIDDDIKDYEINDEENTEHIDNLDVEDLDFPEDIEAKEIEKQPVIVVKEVIFSKNINSSNTKENTIIARIEETNTTKAEASSNHESELKDSKEIVEKEVVSDTSIEDLEQRAIKSDTETDSDETIELKKGIEQAVLEVNAIETASNTAVVEPEILKELSEKPVERIELDTNDPDTEIDTEVNDSKDLVHAEVVNVESEIEDKEDSSEEPLGYFKTGKNIVFLSQLHF